MTGQETERSVWLGRVVVLSAGAVVVWVYSWIVGPALSQMNPGPAKDEYYNLQIDGFRAGQLAMKVEPNPALARLENPYDPHQNGPYRAHDASYFGGKYYLYFGVTPALLLFLPYRLLTGEYLWHREAVWFFCVASFLTEVWLLAALRRKYFPAVGSGTLALGIIGLGLANGMQPLLRRPDVWEVPIACGSWLLMLALATIWQAWHQPKRRVPWLAAASLVFGLAVGARPTLLFAAGVGLVIPLGAFWREEPPGRRRKLLVAAAVPLGLIGAGLAFYNHARFGSILEFGQRYQLAGVEVAKQRTFGWDFCWMNFRLYFLEAVNWQAYFPFVRGITVPPLPPGHLGAEEPYGVLVNVPLVCLALGLPLGWRRGGSPPAPSLNTWSLTVAAVMAASVLPLLAFAGVCLRYTVDFLPLLIFLAVAGVFALEQAVEHRPVWRRAGRAGWVGLLGLSVVFNFLLASEYKSLLRLRNPRNYAQIAHALNTPVAWLEKIGAVSHGPLELRVVLPPFTGRRVEPLLVTGSGAFKDYIWIEYVDANHLRVGYHHTGDGGPISDIMLVDYIGEHRLVIQSGALWPPRAHPFFDGMDKAEILDIATIVRVELDGRVILQDRMPGYEASPLTRWIGTNPFAQSFGDRFTGQILSHRTLNGWAGKDAIGREEGPVFMKLYFPAGKPSGTSEPLVVTGKPGFGDVLFVRYVDERHVAFGLDHWGSGGPTTNPVPVDFAAMHLIEVHMGSLNASERENKHDDPRRHILELKLDGTTVLHDWLDFHPTTRDQRYFGWNPIGGFTTGFRFTGRRVDIWRGGVGE